MSANLRPSPRKRGSTTNIKFQKGLIRPSNFILSKWIPDQVWDGNPGFIALVSAIVISVLLLAIALSLGLSGFFGRFNILDAEFKEQSLALAEACGSIAILNLAQNPSFNPSNQTVTVGSDSCTIVSLTVVGSNKIIKTQAIIKKAYTNLKIIVDGTTLEILGQEECAVLDSC